MSDTLSNLSNLSRDELEELLRQYARLMLTIDGLWFLGVEKTAGLDAAVKMDEEVWRQFGAIEARRLARVTCGKAIADIDTIDEVARVVAASPTWRSLDHEIHVKETGSRKVCVISVTSCHPQRMRVMKGLGEFPCKSVGTAYLEGLTSALGPELRFRCLVCPPDEHPDDLWCSWELWFERCS
jgi:hypothetical protein